MFIRFVTGFVAAALCFGVAVGSGRAAEGQPRWCTEGTSTFIMGSAGTPQAAVEKIRGGLCKPGDVIGIPGNTSIAIGELCDFSKSIVTQPNGMIICVIR